MVRLLLVLLIFKAFSARADFLGFGSGDKFKSRLPALTTKLKELDLKATPNFEDSFNQSVKEIENAIDSEKLYCSGEATNQEGKTLPPDQKQLCFRELKKNYLEAVDVIFEMKRKYLTVLHTEQMQRLSDIHKKQKADLEKNF